MTPSPRIPTGITPGAEHPARESVIVVHGLWLHGFVMGRFCTRLQRAGFHALTFSYPSLRRPSTENAVALASFIAAIPAARIHLVAHSLGGLISLMCLRHHPDARIARVVLLGAPVAGSAVAARLSQGRLGRWLLGKARAVLPGGIDASPPGNVDVGVIAGTLGVGLGRLILPLRGAHDGTVRVAETRLAGARDSLTLPVSHTGMMFSARVADAVAEFLRSGRFPREVR